MATTADLKKGLCLLWKNEPYLVADKKFVRLGRGSAFFRTKLKNLKTGAVIENTFKSGEKIEEVPLSTQEFQYLYQQNDEYFFMNPHSFEQISLPTSMMADFKNFIKEGSRYQVVFAEEKPVALRPPKKVKLKVIEAENAARGNTATAATKNATLETGYTLQVPLFVKQGDLIVINTETGQYTARA